jgi:hypothetical protein
MGLCSPSKVFSVSCERPPSRTAFLFCAGGSSVVSREVFPSWPLGQQALLSLSSTSTRRTPISSFPKPLKTPLVYEGLFGGAMLDLMHHQSLSVVLAAQKV